MSQDPEKHAWGNNHHSIVQDGKDEVSVYGAKQLESDHDVKSGA